MNFSQDPATGAIYRDDGATFDPWRWHWRSAATTPDDLVPCEVTEALALVTNSAARRVPVGVIGPREASPAQVETAEALGWRLGNLGLTVICGGRQGVMAAVAKGVRAAGGLSVGLLPGSDWRDANEDIELPIATGLGEARNMIIAKSCAVLIAVGGSHGTLSEVAYGLHFGKLVVGLEGAASVEGVHHRKSVEDAIELVAYHLLSEPVMS